ncbi:TetR/AcrR family transcriptional regulator [Nocardia huaxiensis]|uniref:WHG domain-containing protein n=1 Tax=Nocardia huaxiensis TaxID=2755382 RepID=A0A7D7A0M0_9NOCA|nr:TetR/AcrR family transcriptional regulator [Nocardia huaxiensis]QLY33069.1 WHG domain-containing protein [Nocardia huaxiensis]UFS93166.1 WHG domain-containing protein [Nocardia huaxiensis]
MSAARLRSYHHGDLRAELLRRAEAALRRVGVDGLSLRQLARDTGVSHAAPSRHFRDKQALLDALAAEGFTRLGAEFEKAAATGTFLERLHAMARAYLHFSVDNPALLALMFARRHNNPTAAMEEAVARAYAVPVGMIADGQARGEVVDGDPRSICLSAMAALQGLATFVGSGFVNAADADVLLDDTVGYMIDGLRPRH